MRNSASRYLRIVQFTDQTVREFDRYAARWFTRRYVRSVWAG